MPPKKKRAPIVVGTVSTRSTRRESIVNIQITPKTNKPKPKLLGKSLKTAETPEPTIMKLSELPKNPEILELLKDWSDEDDSITSQENESIIIEGPSKLQEESDLQEKQALIDILEGKVEPDESKTDTSIEVEIKEKTTVDDKSVSLSQDSSEDVEMKCDIETVTVYVASPVVVEEQIIIDDSTHLVLAEASEIVIGEDNSNNSEIGLEETPIIEAKIEDTDSNSRVEIVTISESLEEEKMVDEEHDKSIPNKYEIIDNVEVTLEEKVQQLNLQESDGKKEEKMEVEEMCEKTKNIEIFDESESIKSEEKPEETVTEKPEKQERRRGRSSQKFKFVDQKETQEIAIEDVDKNESKIQEQFDTSTINKLETDDIVEEENTNEEPSKFVESATDELKKIEISESKKIKPRKEKKMISEDDRKNIISTKLKRTHKKPKKHEFNEEVRRSTRIKTISNIKKRNSGHGLVKSKSEPALNEPEERDSEKSSDQEKSSSDSSSSRRKTKSSNKAKSKSCEDLSMDSSSSPSISQDSKSDTPPIVSGNGNRRSKMPRVDPEVTQRLKQFQHLKENSYKTDRQVCKEAKKMICDCFMTEEEIKSGEYGCGEDCLNRLLMIECSNMCAVADRCTNKRFQKLQFAPVEVFKTEKKGLGLRAAANIPYGEFILEYVGEVLDPDEFDKRAEHYSQDKNIHYYFMSLRSDAIIDATMKGNISRFINHSCEPNAETQKWTVNGEIRIGFFSTRTILAGEEITFDYRFQRYGKEAQKCLCEAPSCRGWLGEQPGDSEDEEEEEEEEDEEEMEEEEKDASSISSEQVSTQDDATAAVKSDSTSVSMTEPAGVQQVADVEVDKVTEKDATRVETTTTSTTVEPKRKTTRKKPRKELFEDLDQLEEDIDMLITTGLKNQAHTLKLSRLMVRAKDTTQRQKLLRVLRRGELPCRRLFLDYHGLKLMHGYMMDAQDLVLKDPKFESLRLELLQTLAVLPIQNKTMLQDSKVLPTVETWSSGKKLLSEGDDSTKSSIFSESDRGNISNPDQLEEIRFLASKLLEEWASLKESFRIPKKERIEQMKEHEREANRKFMASSYGQEQDNSRKNDHRHNNRTWLRTKVEKETKKNGGNKQEEKPSAAFLKISKHERRKLFALQVELREEERRLKQREMWRQHELNCMMIGTDPRFTAPFDPNRGYQYIWNPQIGQWQSLPLPTSRTEELGVPISTPQAIATSVQTVAIPTSVPSLPPAATVQIEEDPSKVKFAGPIPPPVKLPPKWKCARDKYGRPYYYHISVRRSQWEPPILHEPNDADDSSETYSSSETSSLSSETSSEKSDSDDEIDDTLLLMEVRKQMDSKPQKVKEEEEVKMEIVEPEFSPEIETKTEFFAEDTEEAEATTPDINKESERPSSIDIRLKEQFDLRDDKPPQKKKRVGLCQEIVISPRSEEDRLQFREDLKRYKANKEKLKRQKLYILEQTQRKSGGGTPQDSPSSDSGTKRLKEKKIRTMFKSRMREMADWNSQEAKKVKETFRSSMATTVVGVLNAYRKLDCREARITNTEDFKHLARKLTHFVMLKEMKQIDKIEDLTCTDNVKAKAREYIRKYMSKFGEVYVKRHDEPDFKD